MALVLSIKERGESIVICDDIRVSVTEVRGNLVRLAIDAPRTIPIHRQSVYEAIKAKAKHVQEGQPVNPQTGERDAPDAKANDSQSRG